MTEGLGSRVCILVPDMRPGGAERVCLNLANAFVASGIPVTVALMRKRGELLAALDPSIRIVDLATSRPRYVVGPLVRFLRTERPTAVLANMWPLSVLAVVARGLAGIMCRLVAVEHTTWSASRLAARFRTRLMIKATMRWLLPRADAVVAVSLGAARDLEDFGGLPGRSVHAIYNPVVGVVPPNQLELVTELPAWTEDGHARILAVGTLKRVKDFQTLLRAFAQVRESRPAKLLILGEGAERQALQELSISLGIADEVEMPGFVPETRPFYAAADLFVLSSENEGFGNVIVEALEQGLRVVSTDCPSGPREILAEGRYGRLVPVGDADSMARAMLESLESSHDPEMLRARAQDFTVAKAADAYLDLLLPGWRKGATA